MHRRRNIFSSFTLWLVLLGLISAVAQAMPVPGIILMIYNAAYNFNAIHISLIIVAFIADCLIGPFPLAGLVVPALGLGVFGLWYKSQYDADRAAIPVIEAELQGRNAIAPRRFDPAADSLVTRDNGVMLTYRIPVVYTPNRISPPPDAFISFAIRPRQGCNIFDKARNPSGTDFLMTSFGAGDSIRPDYRHASSYCATRGEVKTTPGTLIEIRNESTPDETIAGRKVSLFGYTLLVDGQQQGRYTAASIDALTAWPTPRIGCGLIDMPAAWICFAQFARERIVLDTVPGAGTPVDHTVTDMLLTVERRTPDEIAALTAR